MEKVLAAWKWLTDLVKGWLNKNPAPLPSGVPDVGNALKTKVAEGEAQAAQQRSEAAAVAASNVAELKAVASTSDEAERRKRLADLANRT